jgi:hypothetical protein
VIFYLGIYSQSPNIPQEHPKDTFETRDGDEFSNTSSSPVASISMNGEERLNKKICMLPSTTAHPFTQLTVQVWQSGGYHCHQIDFEYPDAFGPIQD